MPGPGHFGASHHANARSHQIRDLIQWVLRYDRPLVPVSDAQLANHGRRSFKPLLPRRSKSVIASRLEREPIFSPRDQWDGCDPMATVEMVSGTGKLYRTGAAGSADELEVQLQHGLRQMTAPGPITTGFMRVVMGAQGTLGIVSWAFIVNHVHLALMVGTGRDSVLRLAGRLPRWTLFVNVAAPNYFPEERFAFEGSPQCGLGFILAAIRPVVLQPVLARASPPGPSPGAGAPGFFASPEPHNQFYVTTT